MYVCLCVYIFGTRQAWTREMMHAPVFTSHALGLFPWDSIILQLKCMVLLYRVYNIKLYY